MIKYFLFLKNGLKVKSFLPLFWNYILFSSIFNKLLNNPHHTLLFLSIQQKEINKFKKFLFYKIKNLKLKIAENNDLLNNHQDF